MQVERAGARALQAHSYVGGKGNVHKNPNMKLILTRVLCDVIQPRQVGSVFAFII